MAKYWQENILPHYLQTKNNAEERIFKGKLQNIKWASSRENLS